MKLQITFSYVNLAFGELGGLKFSFKLANISGSYEENKTTPFYPFTVYIMMYWNYII